MNIQRMRTINILFITTLVGSTAWLALGMAQDAPVEVVREGRIEGKNPENGEIYRGDILSGAERTAFLKAHNDARDAVGLTPLAWSDEIAQHSLNWIAVNHQSYLEAARARQLPMLKHSPKGNGKTSPRYGENIACWNGPDSLESHASKAVSAWLQEKPAFDELSRLKPYVVGDEADKTDDKGKPLRVGHYTQMVWKETTTIGGAMFYVTLNGTRTAVVVCNYAPAGNIRGRSPY